MSEMSQAAFAKLAGVSRNAINKAVKANNLKLTPSKKIDDKDPLSIRYLRLRLENERNNLDKEKQKPKPAKKKQKSVEKLKQLCRPEDGEVIDKLAGLNSKLIDPILKQAEKQSGKKRTTPPDLDVTDYDDSIYQAVLDKDIVSIEYKKAQTEKLKIETAEKLKLLVPVETVQKKFGTLSSVILNYFFPMGERLAPIICGICGETSPEKIKKVQKKMDDEITRALSEFKKAAAAGEGG